VALLRAAVRTGVVSGELAEYLIAGLEMPELQLRDAMVPRVDVIAVVEDTAAADAARTMGEHGRKRVPVYRATIDQPIGILHAVDVAHALATGRHDDTAGQLVRPAPSLPETLPLLDGLQAMRSQAAHLVMVSDEHGGFAGLVTLHDLVEQLFGPVPDEFGEPGRDTIQIVGNGEAIVGGAAALHQIERLLHCRFPKSRFVSIGGVVYDRLRRVPRPGDIVELPGLRIEVLAMEGARVRAVRIRTAPRISPDPRLLDIGLGKEVVCRTDVLGRVERLIPNPSTGRAREMVVRYKNRSFVVPLEVVERTDEGVVYLTPAGCDLSRFPTYRLPDVSDRTEVVTPDGPLGYVKQVVLDKTTGAATHVVVRLSSGLLGSRNVVVPLSWARSVSPERIDLTASRDEVLGLPDYRPDDAIRVGMLRRLSEDPRFEGIDRYTLKFEVEGGVVRLTGRVRSTALKLAAEELVASTPGVVAVHNELIADDELALSVERALRASGLQLSELEISVLLGLVKLRGRAATKADRETAANIARAIPGVETVANDLALQTAEVPG
jgi:Mg2+/Co2+ transporter CorC/osmotically-inducible protein OsmY